MTKHTPIPGASAEQSKRRNSGSLFERADATFGLDGIGARVPKNLPAAEPRIAVAKRQAAAARQKEAQAAAPVAEPVVASAAPPDARVDQARSEPRVALSGPAVEIDRDVLRYSGLIVPEDPVTGLLEEFRIIKRELLADARASRDALSRAVLISSPHAGEGKTFCAANLAIALSTEHEIEVLLVDADVINPSLPDYFGVQGSPGLMDALADPSVRPEELALATDIEGLFIMPAGSGSARDAELLASARTGELLDRLTRGAPNRIVIFDTPPALAASPAADLAAHVGQAILIVRADQTGRAAIDDAQQLLSACPDLKLLLNAAKFSPSGRRFGDYAEREGF
ncbi:MAG: P-loop NTPase [Pseudomonadota bacterium]